MTESRTGLSLAALTSLIGSIDRMLAIFERAGKASLDPEARACAMLRALRNRLERERERHPENTPER